MEHERENWEFKKLHRRRNTKKKCDCSFQKCFLILCSRAVAFYVCVCVYTSMCLCMRVRIVDQIICPIVVMLGQSEKEAVTWTCSQLVFFGLSSHQLCKLNTVRSYVLLSGKTWRKALGSSLEDTRSSSKQIPAYPAVLFLSFSCYSLYWELRHLM